MHGQNHIKFLQTALYTSLSGQPRDLRTVTREVKTQAPSETTLRRLASELRHQMCETAIHSVVCLTTGPQHLPNRFFHRVRSSASSFNLQDRRPLLKSSSTCLHLLLLLPVTSSFYLAFSNKSQKAVPTQAVNNPVSLTSFYGL